MSTFILFSSTWYARDYFMPQPPKNALDRILQSSNALRSDLDKALTQGLTVETDNMEIDSLDNKSPR